MFLGDLHVHSNFSDGRLSIPELVDLYGSLGFGAIAVTDHLCEEQSWLGKAAHVLGRTLTPETFPLYMETLREEQQRAWQQYRMLVIPGFEISKNRVANKRSAHILGVGISERVSADMDALEICAKIREQGALAIAAHPVSTRKIEKQTYHLWDRREELRNAFDAWEVASGPFLFDEVKGSGLPVIATSDLHVPRQMTSWKTVFHCERSIEAVLQAIRQQDIGITFYSEDRTDSPRIWKFLDTLAALNSPASLGAGLALSGD